MGIQGLLPLLKSTMHPIHIKDLQGCSVAIDTYSWLHKGALSCSTQLCKGLPTSRHIEYCMHRVNLLRHYGVKPVLVFDGGFLPMKLDQENKRARSRKENLARAIEHESNGNSTAAYECYQKAVDISPSIAHDLIQVLKQENVSYVVAPYEADAQMTFMALNDQVDAVITEDSDLIAFGCPRIIFKMDKYGQGVEFQFSRLQKNKELCFAGFTNQMVLEMCILSGCDYLQSLPGMGLKRAHALISKFKSYEKHVGFASIEAKRKFKTPRKSPTSSVPVDSSCLKEFCFVGAGSGTSPRTMMETLAEPMFTESPSSEEEKANMGDIPLKALVQPLNQSGQAVLKECETKTNQKQERKKVIVRSRYFQHKSTNDECQVSKQIHRSNGDHLSVTNGRARVTSPCFAENRHEEKELKILDVVHRSRKQINPKCKLRETTSSIKFKEANYSIFA